MIWIVRIKNNDENEKEQRIRVVFEPLQELIFLYGEVKVKNNKWFVFSERQHNMKIDLPTLQKHFEYIVEDMKKRLIEYNNLNNGFDVIKLIAIEND